MRTLMVASIALTFTAGFVAGGQWQTPVRAQEFSVTMDCGASSAPQIRTTLYFGLSRPKGSVSELEWQIFMRDEVTKRFPDGLTVWQAEGQWQTPGGGIASSRRCCCWFMAIQQRRGSRCRRSSRRTARRSISNRFCGRAHGSASRRRRDGGVGNNPSR
jgi:Protein of unknown function (DUF3574)